MFTFRLGSVDEPTEYFEVKREVIVTLKGYIDHEILPEVFCLIAQCDAFKLREYNQLEVNRISVGLNAFHLCNVIDSELALTLIKLRELFHIAKTEKAMIFAMSE